MTLNKRFNFDKSFLPKIIIGTDEAGRGPVAGGVFASAVFFDHTDKILLKQLEELNDSKQVSKKKREVLFDIIIENTINSTVCIEVKEIEKINILNSSLKAMNLACSEVIDKILKKYPEKKENLFVLVDGNKFIKNFSYPQQFIIKGDSKSASISAASILAKVSRDRYMLNLHEKYPQYNWQKNAGYLTEEHKQAILKYGITPVHRQSFLGNLKAEQLKLL